MTTDVAAPRAGRREWVGLAVLALTAMLVSVDVFVLLLALPHLSADLGADSIEQLWIMDIYGFMVGGFLVTMGGLGDRIGRRKLLLIGAAAFGIASALAAYATTPEMLIGARALLGIAGATLGPCTLALISNMFRNPKQMGLAIGIWSAFFTVGAILGPIIGGVLLAHFWWGSVFLINIPVMAVLLVFGPVLLPEFKSPAGGRIDLISVGMSLAAILPFVYGFKELAKNGFELVPVLAVVVGIVFGVLFVLRQRTLADPLLDLSLFKNSVFTVGLVSLLAYSLLTGAVMMLATQYFQLVDGLGSLAAGLALLPGMAVSTVAVLVSPILARRVRPAYLISGGLLIVAVGLLLMTQAASSGGSGLLILGFAVWCLGGGPLLSLGIGQVIGSAPPEKAGAAASMPQISNELGAAMGFAIIGSVGAIVYRSTLAVPAGVPSGTADAARESLAGATTAANGLPGDVAGQLLAAAREAFTSGLHTAALISAVVLAGVGVLFFVKCRHIGALGAPAEEAPPAPADEAPEPVSGTPAG
ncbi:MFS transporter [Amycolatopsis sp. A133]|uniref:MFS transporter n=1 Tax=Amycolatopsis sp. A133 TaxID=3064472 RepID=UPI0027E732A6|nr:MFS transporter [Amycolatopsis sp. A133]MDQ7806760.1 MFS transporter [Amycolatopsis sp. A133]